MLQFEAPGAGPGPELLAVPRDVGDGDAIRKEIAAIRRRLLNLNAEQASLESALAALDRQLPALETIAHGPPFEGAAVTNSSPASTKVALFRKLFNGRPDVFPVVGKTATRRAPVIRRPAPTNGRAVYAPNRR